MHFSDLFYKYIPLFLWDGLINCKENIILPNNLRRITLYENPSDYDLKNNREIQWSFRRQLGIDSIAHEICSGKHKSLDDLPVLIENRDCKKGQIKVTRFLDSKNKLEIPSKASKKEIKETDIEGKIIVFEEFQNLKRSWFKLK